MCSSTRKPNQRYQERARSRLVGMDYGRSLCVRIRDGDAMNKLASLTVALGLLSSAEVSAQDAMQYGLKHLQVLAEDGKVRVLKYSPESGNKTPLHSHPSTVLYVVNGGRVRITMPDGSTSDAELKSGTVLLRPPVSHADEALDDVELILIELKNQ